MDGSSEMKFVLKLIRSLLGRGVLSLTHEEAKIRTIDAEFLPGDKREGLEHFEPYGFGSRAHPGAEVFAAFFNGDRSHGVVLATADRRYRLKLEEGEVAIFDDIGQKVHLKRDGISVVTPKNLTAEVGGNFAATVTGTSTLTTNGLTIDSPSTQITGTLTVEKLITGQGGLAISGGSGASVDGDLSTTGDVTAGTISLQNHTHSGVQPGSGSTGKPQ